MNKDLAYYLKELRSLRPDRSSGHPKPHKVCLLMAVMDLINQKQISENKIVLNYLLKKQFSIWFEKYKSGNDVDDPSQPFFYLESSSFWHHSPNPDHQEEYQKRINGRRHGSPAIVVKIIDYAYLDSELFYFMQSPVARTAIFYALQENLDDLGRRFENWALAIGKSEKTVKNYVGAIDGSITNWIREAGLSQNGLFEIGSYQEFMSLSGKARKLEIFGIRDSKGKGMYSAALNLYGEFLADTTQYEVGEDIEAINRDAALDATEKSILINSRIGQGQFRQNLINYWGGCAITAYKNPRVLIASHIKPWKASDNYERLDMYNGVLLLPNLDKVFDLGLISFKDTGTIMLSDHLEEFEVLGIRPDMNITLAKQHQEYLAFHREIVFKH